MNLVGRLYEEAQDDLDALEWKAADRIEELERQLAASQAKTDALMLEYCPDEMTPEQLANYEAHLVSVEDLK